MEDTELVKYSWGTDLVLVIVNGHYTCFRGIVLLILRYSWVYNSFEGILGVLSLLGYLTCFCLTCFILIQLPCSIKTIDSFSFLSSFRFVQLIEVLS